MQIVAAGRRSASSIRRRRRPGCRSGSARSARSSSSRSTATTATSPPRAPWAIKMLLDHYDRYKSRMPKEWFVVDRADFVGLSDEALEMLTERQDLVRDEVPAAARARLPPRAARRERHRVDVLRRAARDRVPRGRRTTTSRRCGSCIRFFNNYLREAIKARNLRAVYDVFHQYRRLGRELVERPGAAARDRQALRLLRGDGADVRHGVRAAARDVRPRLRHAPRVRARVAGRRRPAAEVLSLPHRTGDDVHTMAVKAKLILGGFFVENKLEAEADDRPQEPRATSTAPSIDRAEADAARGRARVLRGHRPPAQPRVRAARAPRAAPRVLRLADRGPAAGRRGDGHDLSAPGAA